ncbi:MAG: CoA ester lyase [Actinomycetia bacterium]|nr:CoA ester lyase [Actinomycetes bacterium]
MRTPPVRSALFVPANRTSWIDKAPEYGADALVLDLEDATPPAEKEAARAIVHERLAPMEERGQGIWVRVNYPDPDQLRADLEAICHPGLGAVCVPKIASPADIAEVDRLITYFEGAAGVPLGTVAIVPLLETAEGIAAPREIFTASDRVRYAGGLAADGADVQRALGYRWSHTFEESFVLRSHALIAARAAGVENPITGLVTVVDLDPVRRFAQQSRGLGYAGMFVIHPTHAPIANDAFSPSAKEVAWAEEVLASYEQAEAGGRGAVLDSRGAMVDAAHVETAELLLARHQRLQALDAAR